VKRSGVWTMSAYGVARIEEIDELSDGRCPFRPVRKHFGIMSFGVNTWTGKSVGDRIINEHDEADEHEELYLVRRPALQHRVLREPCRAYGRCDRAPAAGDRAIRAVPLVRRRGLGLDPVRQQQLVQGAGGLSVV